MAQLSEFITNHWMLWAAFIGISILVLINEFISQNGKAKDLSPQGAVDKINNENALVVDLRDQDSYKNGHIIDSIHAKTEDFEAPKMNKYKNKLIILACARGVQSQAAAHKLQALGYQALVLAGGVEAWQNAGLPLVKGKN